MRKSIVLSTRTDIIVVAKLAQLYEQELSVDRPRTKSALIDMCLHSLLQIAENNKMLKEDVLKIETEAQAYKCLMMLGYDIRDENLRIPKDIFRNIREESIRSTDSEIDIIKKAIEKVDKDL